MQVVSDNLFILKKASFTKIVSDNLFFPKKVWFMQIVSKGYKKPTSK